MERAADSSDLEPASPRGDPRGPGGGAFWLKTRPKPLITTGTPSRESTEILLPPYQAAGPSAEDSTGTLNIQIRIQNSVALGTVSFSRRFAILELL